MTVRRLLGPRWVGLHLLALLLVVTFVLLGFWQLHRAEAMVRPAGGADPAPVALSTLSAATGLLPGDAVGRRVVATGRYDAEHGFLVPGRDQGGRQGYWVVGVLRQADGSGVLVLRGWTPSAQPPPAAPVAGTVTVEGRLAASEDPAGGLPPGQSLPPGQQPAVSPVDLLASVPYQVHDGYVVATGQQPADPAQQVLTPVTVGPPGSQVPGFFLQHVGYVGLWWLFALFVVAFWVRLVYDELRPPLPDGDAPPAVPATEPLSGRG